MIEQLTLVAAALLGFVGAPWPFVVIPTAVLTAVSSDRIFAAARRYAPLGISRVFSVSVPTVVAHALISTKARIMYCI